MAGRLTKDGIVQAALDLLDEVGLGGLTVRALAAKLDVQPPALYWHVRDKQALMDEIGTEIWRRIGAELGALPSDVPWDAELRAFADVTRHAFLSHRDGARVFSGTYLTDADVLRRQETSMRRWLDQGFTLADVTRAFSLMYSFVVGFCIEEQSVASAPDSQYALEVRAERIGADEYPLVATAGAEIFADPDLRFADQVAVLTDAVGRFRS